MATTVHDPESRLEEPEVTATDTPPDADTTAGEHGAVTVPAPRDAADDAGPDDAGEEAAAAAAADPHAGPTDGSTATEVLTRPVHSIYAVGTRLDVDPRDLVIGPNVRSEANPTREFVASVKEFGVLHAIRVYQDPEGHLLVEDGQCRTVVSVDVGRPTVPVEIIEAPSNAARIYQQLTQNDARHAVTTADRARAILQLTLEGEKPGRIARRTGRKAAEVKALVAVGSSTVAAQAADAHGLDLLQAAAVAEFADDEQAVEKLVAAATGRTYQGFDHVLQGLRDARESAKKKAALLARCQAEKLHVVEDAGYGCTEQPLSRIGIYDDDGVENHRKSCPGHAVVLRDQWVGTAREWVAVPVCVDPAANGHKLPESTGTGIGEPKKKLADMTEEEAAAARAERRTVRENNAAWQSATTLRRQWLATFAGSTRVPPGAELFVLGELVQTPWYLLDSLRESREILGKALLSGKETDRAVTTDDLAAAILGKAGGNPKRALVQTAALIFAAWERNHGADDRGKDTWRRFGEPDTRVLRQMELWGYQLSEVERLVAHPEPAPETERSPALPAAAGSPDDAPQADADAGTEQHDGDAADPTEAGEESTDEAHPAAAPAGRTAAETADEAADATDTAPRRSRRARAGEDGDDVAAPTEQPQRAAEGADEAPTGAGDDDAEADPAAGRDEIAEPQHH